MSLRGAAVDEGNRTLVFTLGGIWLFEMVRSFVGQIVSKFLLERKPLPSCPNNGAAAFRLDPDEPRFLKRSKEQWEKTW
jgi:hypothetical protein